MSDSTPLYLSEDEARTEICRVGRELFTRGYVPVSYTHLTLPTKA